MDWNLNDLPIFITVQTLGKCQKQREDCTQKSSVSRAISRLEDSFNTTLMERNSRHLKLTSDGEKLYQQVQPWCKACYSKTADASQSLKVL